MPGKPLRGKGLEEARGLAGMRERLAAPGGEFILQAVRSGACSASSRCAMGAQQALDLMA